MNTEFDKFRVLIVGAGPVGLTLACFLSMAKINFRIIDKRQSGSIITRGVGINHISLEIFSKLGILGRVLEESIFIKNLSIFWERNRVLSINNYKDEANIPAFVHSTQPALEKILYERILNLGGEVERDTNFVSLEMSEDDLLVNLSSVDGRTVENFHLVVGCDGGNSAVRSSIGISCTNEDYAAYFLLADVEMHWITNSSTSYYLDESGYIMIIPIPQGNYRIVISNFSPYKNNINDEEIVKEFLEVNVKKRTGVLIEIKNIIWVTSAPFRHKIAKNSYLGRVVLAGDALHTFSPVGGTNMNVGIDDAFCLAEKIIAMKNELSVKKFLSSYAFARYKIIAKNLNFTKSITNIMIRSPRRDKVVESMFLPGFKNRNFIKSVVPLLYSGQISRVKTNF